MYTYLVTFSISILSSLVLTRMVRDWANRRGWVDQPDFSRKLHTVPIPRVGGIAIYLSLLAVLILVCLLPTEVAHYFRRHLAHAGTLLGLGGLMFLIGLWDDLRNLSPWTKFTAQVAVAVICWAIGYRILASWTGAGTVFYLGLLSLPLTVLWIVGITNAFNLIDGMDGLSPGAALLSTISMIAVSILNNDPFSPVVQAALAGSILGFLRYNFNPASIFLGDSGSLLLGFMLALLSVETAQKSTTAFTIAVPIVAFGLPVLDTAMVMLRRFLNGKPIFVGDRRHIHHVLIERGLKPRNAVILLYGVCGLFGLFSLLFMNPLGRNVGLSLAILGICLWFGIQQLHYPELRELNGYVARGVQHQRRLITGNVIVGRMIDGFRSAQNLSDLLESLSMVLKEMSFSMAEVRLPSVNENRLLLRARNWRTVCDGRRHCLYQWFAVNTSAGSNIADSGPPPPKNRMSPGRDFRLEFVFGVARNPTPEPGARAEGSDIGRLTFYHPAGSEYPVSAICLLSRNVWTEFGNAISRIMAQPNAGFVEGRSVRREEIVAQTFFPAAASRAPGWPVRPTAQETQAKGA